MAPRWVGAWIPFLAALIGGRLAPFAKPSVPLPSAVATGSVDVLLQAGGSLYGPYLGLKARFPNGFELGFRHSQWQEGQSQDLGFYFLPASRLASGRRPYFGTEFFRANRAAYAFRGVPALSNLPAHPAILLVAGQEHRLASRLALSYEAAAGARLTRRYSGLLPPLTAQVRAQMLCRVF